MAALLGCTVLSGNGAELAELLVTNRHWVFMDPFSVGHRPPADPHQPPSPMMRALPPGVWLDPQSMAAAAAVSGGGGGIASNKRKWPAGEETLQLGIKVPLCVLISGLQMCH